MVMRAFGGAAGLPGAGAAEDASAFGLLAAAFCSAGVWLAPRKPFLASTYRCMSTSARRVMRSTPLTVGLVAFSLPAALPAVCGGLAGLAGSVARYTSIPVAVMTVGFGLLDRSMILTTSAVQIRCRFS